MLINFNPFFFRSFHPQRSEEQPSQEKALPSDLWQSPKFPKTTFWQPLVHQVNRPFDWLLERASNLACQKIQGFESYRKMVTDTQLFHVHEWCTIVGTNSLAEMMSKPKSDMPPSRLRAILSILQWTRDHVLARNQVCIDQLKHLDDRRIPAALEAQRPTWLVDSIVAEHLDSVRQWAEQADRGIFIVKEYHFGSLTNAQLDDLYLGLEIVEQLFWTKQLERSCAATIKMHNRCKNLVKIAFIAPIALMTILPKKISWQLPLPFLGVACLIGAGFTFYQSMIRELEKIDPRVSEAKKHCFELRTALINLIIVRRKRAHEVAEKKKEEAMREAREEAEKLRQQVIHLTGDLNQLREEMEQIRGQSSQMAAKTENEAVVSQI